MTTVSPESQKERGKGTGLTRSKKNWLQTFIWQKTETYGFRKLVNHKQDKPKEMLSKPHRSETSNL